MSDPLRRLMQHNIISPLTYYFAQFIARQSQQTMDSILCLTAALVSQRNQQGDICIDLNDYAEKKYFETDDIQIDYLPEAPNIHDWTDTLKAHSCVSCDATPQALILDQQSLYLGKLWHFETFIAQQIQNRLAPQSINETRLKHSLKRLFNTTPEGTIDWQKIAASIAVIHPFCVISGGPGTGKTTTLIKVLALLIEQNPTLDIQLCAPTGKAAIRMLEAINARKNDLQLEPAILQQLPQQAKTIHRLLGYQQGIFRANKNQPLVVDCLVIDEASMIDLELMYHLMAALPDTCRLILLGDKDQLSSVDAGHVFSDICGRGQPVLYSPQQTQVLNTLNDITLESHSNTPAISDAVVLLKNSFRFSHDSSIGQLAKHVNDGQGETALQYLMSAPQDLNYFDITTDDIPQKLLQIAVEHYQKVVTANSIHEAFKAFAQFQWLCAVHKGTFGVDNINELITQRLLLRKHIKTSSHFQGKPVLITQNDYEHHIFNGDIGLMWQEKDQYLVYFEQHDGSFKSFPLISLNHYKTAWAITVHKSQGSEYNNIVLLLGNTLSRAINQELLYTGITRAKRHLSICTTASVFIHSCAQKTRRSSNLSPKLGWGKSSKQGS